MTYNCTKIEALCVLLEVFKNKHVLSDRIFQLETYNSLEELLDLEDQLIDEYKEFNKYLKPKSVIELVNWSEKFQSRMIEFNTLQMCN